MKRKVYIETFGCQMNEHDSDRIMRNLVAGEYEVVFDEDLADVVILNTCSIRDKAEKKVLSKIGRLASLKRKGRDLLIGVVGCMAQRLGSEIIDKYSEVDMVFGTHVIPGASYFLDKAFEGEKIVDTTQKGVDEFEFLNLPTADYKYKENVKAEVTIMNGCNNYCSYCVVPYVRGPEISRSPKAIIDEIKSLVDRGVKEVLLLGQNVNSYGMSSDSDSNFDSDLDCGFDYDCNDTRFVKLLKKINEIDGLERIRFVTSHPKDLGDDLIELFGKMPKLCEHIHLPVQSGSDKILKAMNRHYTYDSYIQLIRKLNHACPGISITTDIIVAYPGETDEDFQRTIDLVREANFDGSFSFKYSPRPGTKASEIKKLVDPEIAQARLARLQKMQIAMTYENNQDYVGTEVEVLVEGESKKGGKEFFGRTRTNKIVNFLSNCNTLGKLIKLKVTKAGKNSLYGELIDV